MAGYYCQKRHFVNNRSFLFFDYCQKRCFVKINIFDKDFLFKHSIRDHDFWYPFWYPKVIYMSLF